ncbi:transketolase family protein, partial [Candidatus Micrarchaeota archaeon]|nr:transketolase family protein [Candidatus Micrarchaeota archaeon]
MNAEMNLIESIHSPKEKKATREGIGKALAEEGAKNENIWVLSADVAESTRVNEFAEKFPKRFVQLGVAEQNMAGVASGIASIGKVAVISAYAVFSPGRNWDQIRVSICYNDSNVKIHGSHSGLTVGPDGASHQALEDIAITRTLPNLVVMAPADAVEAEKMMLAALAHRGPVYIRTSRDKTPTFTTERTPFEIGKANVCRDGNDVAIIAHGLQVYQSLLAAEELAKEGIDAAVIDCHTIKPIDKETIVKYARKTGLVVTAEEHQVHGGMGSAVA